MNAQTKVKNVIESAECLFNMEDINLALDKMSDEITAKLQHEKPLLLCVMIGALIPMGHLVTRLNFPLEIDYVHATRYNSSTRGGDLTWYVKPRQSLKDRTILIMDDVMDGGLTLQGIIDFCKKEGAKKVYTAVMVDKIREREPAVKFEPDFIGLTAENKYLYGFGLDYEEFLRNAPGIYAVAPEHQ